MPERLMHSHHRCSKPPRSGYTKQPGTRGSRCCDCQPHACKMALSISYTCCEKPVLMRAVPAPIATSHSGLAKRPGPGVTMRSNHAVQLFGRSCLPLNVHSSPSPQGFDTNGRIWSGALAANESHVGANRTSTSGSQKTMWASVLWCPADASRYAALM